jgi:hypothetical protein
MFVTWSITTDENLINVGHVLFLAQLASLPGQNASPEIWAGAALFASCRIIDIAANRRAILEAWQEDSTSTPAKMYLC